MEKSVEDEILGNLLEGGVDFGAIRKNGSCFGAAVSGGADSMCLLFALSRICKGEHVPLKVITVNHRIRSEEESGGDAQYVEEMCGRLCEDGYDVECFLYAFEEGAVLKACEERGRGVEDAARFLRYNAFEDFAKKTGAGFLCLAHNFEDNLETILMRFLQGGNTSVLRGIKYRRGIFLRPMLSISRRRIEDYLIGRNIAWRTDRTNFDENYLRNRIRRSLIPLLDEKFLGWRQGVTMAALKLSDDDNALEGLCAAVGEGERTEDGAIQFSLDSLFGLPRAVLTRVVFRAISKIAGETRFPYMHVRATLDAIASKEKKFLVESGGVRLLIDKGNLFVKLRQNIATDSCFFAIIEREGNYEFPFGTVFVRINGNAAEIHINDRVFSRIPVPFCIRSRQTDDFVKTRDGGRKSVSDFLSSLHVPNNDWNGIPVIQELLSTNQEIVVVASSVMGYKDWVCKD